MKMNSNERAIKSLNFQKPDRMPIFDNFWGEFVENWRKEKEVSQKVDIRDYYGIELSVPVADEIFFPSNIGVIKQERDYSISRDGWGRTVRTRKSASFLDMLIEAGIDGINPVEPKAGMDILELKKKYGNKLSYIGGVDNAFVLPSGDKEKIKKHILPILEAGKEGGIIIGAHSIGPDVSVGAYEYYHNLVKEFTCII